VTRNADAAALDRWREYVAERSGMELTGARSRALASAVAVRTAAAGYASTEAYFCALALPTGAAEWEKLVAALLNGDTRFNRDPAALAAFARVLPELAAARSNERELKLWSAGCSAGQEAYSLALACRAEPMLAGWRFEILGTDLSATALERATASAYSAAELSDVPDGVRRRYFAPHGDKFRATDELRTGVRFEPHDLLNGPDHGPRDAIFCQNVLIYYRRPARAAIVRRLQAALAPHGFLFLGPGEALGLSLDGLEPLNCPDACVYRRAAERSQRVT
jgi:chemotaxis methyl-accepting protein methylase